MTQAMCTSFKLGLAKAQHNFSASGGHQYKLALYTGAVTLDASTTDYSSSGEVVSAGYTPGGFLLTNVEPSADGTTVMITFASPPSWTGVSFAPTQALLYNVTAGNKAVAVLDFGGVQSITVGDFVVTLPPVTKTTALLRLI